MYCYGILEDEAGEPKFYLTSGFLCSTFEKISNCSIQVLPLEELADDTVFVYTPIDKDSSVMTSESMCEEFEEFRLLRFPCSSFYMSNLCNTFVNVSVDNIQKHRRHTRVMFTVFAKNAREVAEHISTLFPTAYASSLDVHGELFRCELRLKDFENICKITAKYLLIPTINANNSAKCNLSDMEFSGICRRLEYYAKQNSYPNLSSYPNIELYQQKLELGNDELVRELSTLMKRYKVFSLEDLNDVIHLPF